MYVLLFYILYVYSLLYTSYLCTRVSHVKDKFPSLCDGQLRFSDSNVCQLIHNAEVKPITYAVLSLMRYLSGECFLV